MRYSLDLSNEEVDFIQKRKPLVFEAMKKLLGKDGPETLDEVRDKTTGENLGKYKQTNNAFLSEWKIFAVRVKQTTAKLNRSL